MNYVPMGPKPIWPYTKICVEIHYKLLAKQVLKGECCIKTINHLSQNVIKGHKTPYKEMQGYS